MHCIPSQNPQLPNTRGSFLRNCSPHLELCGLPQKAMNVNEFHFCACWHLISKAGSGYPFARTAFCQKSETVRPHFQTSVFYHSLLSPTLSFPCQVSHSLVCEGPSINPTWPRTYVTPCQCYHVYLWPQSCRIDTILLQLLSFHFSPLV